MIGGELPDPNDPGAAAFTLFVLLAFFGLLIVLTAIAENTALGRRVTDWLAHKLRGF